MDTQKTPVEWLINELDYETISRFDKQLKQAKEMEREQKYTEQEMLDYGRFSVQCEKQGFIIPTNRTT
jgi:hypothetical protein